MHIPGDASFPTALLLQSVGTKLSTSLPLQKAAILSGIVSISATGTSSKHVPLSEILEHIEVSFMLIYLLFTLKKKCVYIKTKANARLLTWMLYTRLVAYILPALKVQEEIWFFLYLYLTSSGAGQSERETEKSTSLYVYILIPRQAYVWFSSVFTLLIRHLFLSVGFWTSKPWKNEENISIRK